MSEIDDLDEEFGACRSAGTYRHTSVQCQALVLTGKRCKRWAELQIGGVHYCRAHAHAVRRREP